MGGVYEPNTIIRQKVFHGTHFQLPSLQKPQFLGFFDQKTAIYRIRLDHPWHVFDRNLSLPEIASSIKFYQSLTKF